jgi:uncharacterized protein YehS (DUF1456 family)
MNIEAEKLKLVQMILNIDSEATIDKIKSLLKKDTETDFWDELHDDVKAGVEEAIKELDEGGGIPHDEVVKEYAKWLRKLFGQKEQ